MTDGSGEHRRPFTNRTIALVSIVVVTVVALVLVGIFASQGNLGKTSGVIPATGLPSASPSVPVADASNPPPEQSPRPLAEPKPIGSETELISGVSVGIGELTAVDGVAVNPGEIAGPAIRVQVSIRNDSSADISLSTLVVSADYGDDRTPASELSGSEETRLPIGIAAGAQADGAYVFAVPLRGRSLVRITVDYAVGTAPLVFEGPAPQ